MAHSASGTTGTRVVAVPSATEGRRAPDTGVPVPDTMERFLGEGDPMRALVLWLRHAHPDARVADAARLVRLLQRDIVAIDRLLSAQLDAILHHPRLQRLEASWRGLRHLVDRVAAARAGSDAPPVRVRVLDVSWRELARDFERAAEFDQSQVFKKVYEAEFGTAGGEPFGVLLGDYEVRHRLGPGHTVSDVDVLDAMSHVASAAFAPFVVGAHPALFGVDAFRGLELPRDLSSSFDDAEYVRWNAFRRGDDARFVGVTVPRVLMRAPYAADGTRVDRFVYDEDVRGRSADAYLWGTSVYAFGEVLARAFSRFAWPADIRGLPAEGGGGRVTGLATSDFGTERAGRARRSSTDVLVAERLEQELSDLGFMALCHLRESDDCAFFATPSIHASGGEATLTSLLQHVLCVSRVAHYVKVIGRDKIGSYASADDCEVELDRWLGRYCTSMDDSSFETRARCPLAEGRVEVREHPGRPGCYACVIHLRPHFQLDQVLTTVRLVTEFAPVRPD